MSKFLSALFLVLTVGSLIGQPSQATYAATLTVNDEASLVVAINTANATPEPDMVVLQKTD